ncbi:MAG TPA: hypothetical protein VKG91_18445 [Roseiarcus sp.]|nr:hypothetical protein [Roseiarcus sp.]
MIDDVTRKPLATIERERGARDWSATAPKIQTNDLRKTEAVLPWFHVGDQARALPDSRRLGAKASKKAGENSYLESLESL